MELTLHNVKADLKVHEGMANYKDRQCDNMGPRESKVFF